MMRVLCVSLLLRQAVDERLPQVDLCDRGFFCDVSKLSDVKASSALYQRDSNCSSHHMTIKTLQMLSNLAEAHRGMLCHKPARQLLTIIAADLPH